MQTNTLKKVPTRKNFQTKIEGINAMLDQAMVTRMSNVRQAIVLSERAKKQSVIHDYAWGIAASHCKLGRFHMILGNNDEVQGSGLGMFILQSAVEKLGGEVKLTSELGEGTKFEIFILLNSGELETDLKSKHSRVINY